MKYSLYEECIHKFSDLKFSREELDIIQSTFNISVGVNYEIDKKCIIKCVNGSNYYHFEIWSDFIKYVKKDTYFGYKCEDNLNCAYLVLKKDDGVYFVNIDNHNFSIKYYDDLALSCVQKRYGNVKIDKDIIEYFSAIGILPDNVYESNVNSLILNHFNIIKLLMTRDDSFNKLFNGDNIDDLLIEQKYVPAIKRKK